MKKRSLFLFFCIITIQVIGQPYWHGIERKQRYHPEGNDIVIQNGQRRFNRALYGGNTAFRAEAGDLPEFALYLPGMGGNLKFGLIRGGVSKWLTQASSVKAIYRAGSMLYGIQDPLLGNGVLELQLIASYDREGLILKITADQMPEDLRVLAVYGGVSGKKFSRDGDIGADPESSFDLKPEYCTGNIVSVDQHVVSVKATQGNRSVKLYSAPQINFFEGRSDAQDSPLMLLASKRKNTQPLVMGLIDLKQPQYLMLDADEKIMGEQSIAEQLTQNEKQRQQIANKLIIHTPDPFLNAMAAPLAIAADAIWEYPSYMHGAVAWRMRLNGWRGGYIADVFGWHDRARALFDGYLNVQIKGEPSTKVEMDTALQLARHKEELGNSLFSSGYISREPNSKIRPHHYDMNLVFIDQLLNHLNWTGDTAYARKVWDNLVLHVNWEKRNFDPDDDGLYDAYAAIWASDALQYSAGAVTHSTAYNYRTNRDMVTIGTLLGKDITTYTREAEKIRNAVNKQLWLRNKGWYAEFKDAFGEQLIHDQPGVWTIYHAIDEGIADPFQSWQTLRYIDHVIPHIPMRIKDFPDTSLYTLSTTNWQPYTWSLNNVALSELMHTALAYWQAQRYDEANKLFRSSILESMFFGASPGNVQQLTFYDAMRGELYRDFADAIGTTGRTLVEGMFGILPDQLQQKLTIRPGFPSTWDTAFIQTTDITFSFKRTGTRSMYQVIQKLSDALQVNWQIPIHHSNVKRVLLNGKPVKWVIRDHSISFPILDCTTPLAQTSTLEIETEDQPLDPFISYSLLVGESFAFTTSGTIKNVYDPQNVLMNGKRTLHQLKGLINHPGIATLFLQVQQGNTHRWLPIHLQVKDNKEQVYVEQKKISAHAETLDIKPWYNARVTDIFTQKYLSPRPKQPTLQLPVQGIGNWAYPMVQPMIDDSGFRQKADSNGIIRLLDIPFKTAPIGSNIVFVSKWDNYPDSMIIPLKGNASFAHLLMAGSTNPMQTRLTNGVVEVEYMDGAKSILALRNPENWWPIEQDYFTDGYAFTTNAPKPIRVSLKSGNVLTNDHKYTGIKGFSSFGIEGGAATVLGIHLNKEKPLKQLKLKAVANDVVIGLMGLTLER